MASRLVVQQAQGLDELVDVLIDQRPGLVAERVGDGSGETLVAAGSGQRAAS